MKKISVSISYDEEKLSTLRLYLEQKGILRCQGAFEFDTFAVQAVLRFKQQHSDVRLTLVLLCKDWAIEWSSADVEVRVDKITCR